MTVSFPVNDLFLIVMQIAYALPGIDEVSARTVSFFEAKLVLAHWFRSVLSISSFSMVSSCVHLSTLVIGVHIRYSTFPSARE